jgi:cell wall-associated NlpC family hydrolase
MTVVIVAGLLAACSPSQPPGNAPTAAAPAAPVVDAQQAKSIELYRQLLQQQAWELAAPIGKEIVDKYPGSAAATEVQQTLADATTKATAITARRRLTALWIYQTAKESGAEQHTASIYSSDVTVDQRVRLILRRHADWGQSVYLFGGGKGFECRGTCMLAARFDDRAQKIAAYLPDTGEPAVFIKDDKAFIAKLEGTQKLSIDVTEKGKPPRTLVFEVGGYDGAKFPPLPKKAGKK